MGKCLLFHTGVVGDLSVSSVYNHCSFDDAVPNRENDFRFLVVFLCW